MIHTIVMAIVSNQYTYKMKTVLSLIGIAMMSMTFLFSSCSDSQDSISESQILKQCNKVLKESANDQTFCTIQTGYYELNSQSSRYALRRMAAAGLINYDVERYAWWKKEVHTYRERAGLNYYTYDWNYTTRSYTTYDYNEHFFVKVDLTEKAKQLQVTSLPLPIEDEDLDMKQPDFNEEDYPESKVEYAESWPRIPRPDEKVEEGASDTITIDDSKVDEIEAVVEEEEPGKPEEMEEQEKAYHEAKAKITSDEAYLKAYTVKFVKARNIVIHDNNGIHTATAEAISEIDNVTEAGRVAYSVAKGMRKSADVAFNYYLDKGWEIKK